MSGQLVPFFVQLIPKFYVWPLAIFARKWKLSRLFNWSPVRSPAIVDMWQVLVLLLTNSVFSAQTEDSLNVILAEKDSQTNTSLLKPLVKAENQTLGSSGKESQPGPLVEENKEEKSALLWRLLNIAAGSLLVLVYMHVAAVFAMIIGVNLESD